MRKYPFVWFLLCISVPISSMAQNADSATFYNQKGLAEEQARRYREAEKTLFQIRSVCSR